jgi:NodT family efflux transporter outer membrane factor (OMF) lipoprotein
MIARRNLSWLAPVVLLAACALKQPPDADEVRRQALPNTQVPERWASQGAAGGSVQQGWFEQFADTRLTPLVEEALVYNADLRVAGARIEQAAAYTKIAASRLYPAVNLLARGGGELSGDNSGLQGVLVSAGWEIDVWGRVRYGAAAANAQYASALADMEYARQSLVALVVKSWLTAIEGKLQRQLAEDTVRSQEQLVKLARDRERVGRGDAIDVANAQANLETARDTLRQVELSYQQAVRALELLVGRYPAASLDTPAELPPLPPPVPAGLPSELLERRPDVIAAERRVAAAFNRVGEARAAMLPQISLTASVSTISSDLFVLKDRDNPAWSAGAGLLAPLYQGGALRAQVSVRTAEQKEAVAEYARVGQRAFGEVEDAISRDSSARDRELILARAVSESQRALDLSRSAYEVGSIDLRSVQQQQLALFASRSALLRVQSDQRVQRVNLHLALGGGFGGPESTLRDRTVSRVEGNVTIVDVYRVVGTGGAEIRAPASGWPQTVKVRLHGFQPLALVRADAITSTATLDLHMTCEPSRSMLGRNAYRCLLAGKPAGETRTGDDYLEIDLPPAMLVPDTARVEVRWSETTAVAAR